MSWAPFTLDSLTSLDSWGIRYKVCRNTNKGEFSDSGIYMAPEEVWENDCGILAPLNLENLTPAEQLVYTSQDMYCYSKSNYEIGNLIKKDDLVYKVHERGDWSNYDQTKLRSYRLKKVQTKEKSNRG